MTHRDVRIYKGPENTDLIGFSGRTAPEESDYFEDFLEEKGYSSERLARGTERYDTLVRGLGGISIVYYAIKPPFKEEHQEDLASWCVEHIDTGGENGFLVDNRMTRMPMQPFHDTDQKVLAQF